MMAPKQPQDSETTGRGCPLLWQIDHRTAKVAMEFYAALGLLVAGTALFAYAVARSV
jgi:hypothetical protein